MRHKKNYTGYKAGQLELLVFSRPGGKGVGSIWWAICNCGNRTEVQARQVIAGRVKTCGNCGIGLGIQASVLMSLPALPKGHQEYYKSILRKLIAIGVVPYITPDMYTKLLGNRCVGCNNSDTHVELAMQPQRGEDYTHTALVPICRACSGWRRDRNVVDWLAHCIRVADSVRSRLPE